MLLLLLKLLREVERRTCLWFSVFWCLLLGDFLPPVIKIDVNKIKDEAEAEQEEEEEEAAAAADADAAEE